ncbi:hypothetical protein U737_13715 [Methylomonas sp. LW13]|uniref:restriction endonuclease subunit S n=1 Tax=unclassified Methylomonas TaxID=2608980 RepID=UPI00068AC7F4|nr:MULTISPECIES: restriction endonuclease subunit S [unclassified Methylomonas]PKD39691.1 hypothetical protein CWO84_13895 [Methylomonas sp. Kb3]QBC27872.1 hypothetical protein U737_13715 [Methylomonas sp. LW13]
MSPFSFNPNVGIHKVFLVSYSQLAGRFDPQFHLELPDLTDFIKLSSIANVNGGKRIPLGYDYSQDETEYLYLRVTDFNDEGEIDFQKLRHIDSDVFAFLERYEIRNNQIAISIAGTIGRVTLIKNIPLNKRVILTENCAKITLKTDSVLEAYFNLLLNLPIVQKQIELNYIQTTIPKLGLDRIKNLFFPKIPTIEKQEKIVQAYSNVSASAKQKEQQSQELLAGIDGYLLSELGITVPNKNKTIEKRIFKVSFNQISGWRFDAPVHQSEFSLKSAKFSMIRLTRAFEFNPKTVINVESCSFVPMEKISDQTGSITSTEETIHLSNSSGYTPFCEDDLIWARITPCMQNGKSAVARNLVNGFGLGSTEYFVFRATEGNNIDYLHALLRLNYLREEAMLFFGGATGHQRVSPDFFRRLYIPFPPIGKQNEIAQHIADIKTQAQQLQTEAAQILADAKAEVERMILGDSGGEPCPPAG